MVALRIIFRFLALFESNVSTRQLALSVLYGMLFGLSSPTTLQWWLYAASLFLLRFNLTLFLVSWCVWEGVAKIFAPQFHQLGYFLLSRPSLTKFWATLYHLPLFPYTRFNMTTFLGEGLTAFCLAVPLFMFSCWFIRVVQPSIYHGWRSTKLYRTYVFYKPYTR